MMMQVHQELLSDLCPVCRQAAREVRIVRIAVKRQSGQLPIEHTVECIVHEVTYACDMVRSCTLAKGRWSEWQYDPKSKCQNAQQVALRDSGKGGYHGIEV